MRVNFLGHGTCNSPPGERIVHWFNVLQIEHFNKIYRLNLEMLCVSVPGLVPPSAIGLSFRRAIRARRDQ